MKSRGAVHLWQTREGATPGSEAAAAGASPLGRGWHQSHVVTLELTGGPLRSRLQRFPTHRAGWARGLAFLGLAPAQAPHVG